MLKQELLNVQRAVEKRLKFLLETACKDVPKRLQKAMVYGTLKGGKRLRPFLHLISARLFDGNEPIALDIACALEMIHCYSLIHDDLPGMDNAAFRRGQPSVHAQFDGHTAILAGSALQNFAFESLTQVNVPEHKRLKLIQGLAVASGSLGMMGGQQLDMDAEKASNPLSIEDISHLQDLKTGALIVYALESAYIAFAQEERLPKNLALYGKNIGLVYQITDDLMDFQSTLGHTGKPTQADTHKATLVTHLGIDKARALAKGLIEEACTAIDFYGAKALPLQALGRSLLDRAT